MDKIRAIILIICGICLIFKFFKSLGKENYLGLNKKLLQLMNTTPLTSPLSLEAIENTNAVQAVAFVQNMKRKVHSMMIARIADIIKETTTNLNNRIK